MRLKIGFEDNYKIGDTRIITKFLWYPLMINGEVRFLEKASYRQVYGHEVSTSTLPLVPQPYPDGLLPVWKNVEWVD
jgi:hypothetical protein